MEPNTVLRTVDITTLCDSYGCCHVLPSAEPRSVRGDLAGGADVAVAVLAGHRACAGHTAAVEAAHRHVDDAAGQRLAVAVELVVLCAALRHHATATAVDQRAVADAGLGHIGLREAGEVRVGVVDEAGAHGGHGRCGRGAQGGQRRQRQETGLGHEKFSLRLG